jgi:hypothetical protein
LTETRGRLYDGILTDASAILMLYSVVGMRRVVSGWTWVRYVVQFHTSLVINEKKGGLDDVGQRGWDINMLREESVVNGRGG